jgi:hypothetical protein
MEHMRTTNPPLQNNGSLLSTALNLGGGTFTYTCSGNTTQTFTTTTVSGASAVSAGDSTLAGGTINISLNAVAIPEPRAALLGGLGGLGGLGMLTLLRIRNRKWDQ